MQAGVCDSPDSNQRTKTVSINSNHLGPAGGQAEQLEQKINMLCSPV